MLGRNHLLLGTIIGSSTALAMNAAGMDVNTGVVMGVTMLGAVLPDIDLPFTIAGTIFLPISCVLYKFFGHRGFIHSPLFVLLAGVVFYFALPYSYFLAIVVGMVSHLVADFFTKGGIPLLYPFIKDRQAFWDKKAGSFGEIFIASGLGVVYALILDAYVPFISIFFNMV